MDQYNEYDVYTPDFKRRNEMEQRLIEWARKKFQGRKPFRIAEACQMLIAVRDDLQMSGVRGTVRIGEPSVTGTWAGGSVSLKEFCVYAAGRKIPSLRVSESYPPSKA